ncbi:hypothetical protein [Natrononativus amylolyticus]|uniref:hypothetical protein n=1 Tax=Natrononativus amylolyticus TaxID=2963434 RepID=UPI0020CC4614|nr:hypothetical protein [Natrononativus amylolyticus]
MTTTTRRRLLHYGALAGGLSLAGCLASETDGNSPAGDDDSTDGDDETDDGIEAVETIQYTTRTDRPDWDEDAIGTCALAGSEDRLAHVTPIHAVSEERLEETVGPFVRETDFESQLLLFVESGGPNICHDTLEIEDVSLEGEVLTATATVLETSDKGAECGQALLYPSALARVTVADDAEWPARTEVTITDGWDETETVEAALDISVEPEELEGYVRPDGDPDIVPSALECADEDVTRMSPVEDVTWGDTDRFSMRVDRLTVDRGESVAIKMVNTTNESQTTGNAQKFGLEVYTDAGWQDVRVYDDDGYGPGYTDEGYTHQPHTGFDWTLEMATGDFDTGHPLLEVCPDLPAGRYRFVYWPTDLAVAFDLSE